VIDVKMASGISLNPIQTDVNLANATNEGQSNEILVIKKLELVDVNEMFEDLLAANVCQDIGISEPPPKVVKNVVVIQVVHETSLAMISPDTARVDHT